MNDDRQAKAEQPREGADMKAWVAGEVAGTGMFRCTSCGNSVAVEAVDELPSCPSCGGVEFIRASLFTTAQNDLVELRSDVVDPGWIEELRTGLSDPGQYLAYRGGDGEVVAYVLEREWTRIGRSLAADVRFDD